MKRFWAWFKSPSRMALGALLLIGGFGGVIFWGGFNTFIEYTNTMAFCTGCHEMGTVYDEYQHSSHYQNNSGVRAICSDCHVPKPWTAKLVRKIKASNEIYHKLMGTIDTPEKFEAKRMELAGNVWRSMKETDSRECRNCHAFETMTTSTQKNDAPFWHPMALDEEFTCIDCHKGIAHKLPDMDYFVQQATDDLKLSLEAQKGQGERVVTASAKSLHEGPGASYGQLADIAVGVSLEVIERGDSGWVKVSLDGFEVLGLNSQLYLDTTHGVVAAEVMGALEYIREESTVDAETRLSWRPARITGWISDEMLAANEETLWNYVKVVYENECARCHAVFPPSRFNAPAWVNSMRNMQRFSTLGDQESALVSAYLQQHAKGLAEY
jgi:trimethylamine-N-oxide reductase cytochrome c-type subunit TorC